MDYDVHSILRVRSNIEIDIPKTFRVSNTVPDVIFHFGDVRSREPYESSICYEHRLLGPIKSRLFLSDLLGRTEIEILDASYKLLHNISRQTLRLIHATLQLKLLQLNHSLLHSACVQSNGEGILLLGPSDTGKTSTALSLVLRHGFQYLSDDMTITNGKDCFCYPTPLTVRSSHVATYRIKLTSLRRAEMIFKELSRGMVVPYILGPFRIEPEQIFQQSNFTEKTRVKFIFLLERGSDQTREVDGDIALRKILAQQRLGLEGSTPYSNPHILLYAYEYPLVDVERFLDLERKIQKNLVEHSRCYILRSRYSRFDKLILRIIGYKG